jgi:hypothetical protein
MGVVTYLLAYEPFARGPARQASPAWFARLVLGVIAAGLTTYLVKSTDAFAWILFGIWPLALLVRGIVTTSVPTGTVGTTLARLGAGAAISALPLVVYHTVHGSWGGWLSDTVGAAIALTRLPFMDKRTYAMMMQHAVASLSASVLGAPNALYWLVLPTTAAILGGCAVWRTWRRGATLPAIVVVATFYGVVSVHYQIPFYLAYTAGLSIAACLFLVDSPRRGPRVAAGAAVMAISGTGLWYHAGQPISHGFGGRLGAPDITLVRPAGVPRAGIRVEPSDASLYGALVHLIQSEATPDESIFAVPSHAELYFLAERRNPFRFYNTALGIRTPAELAQVLEVLEHDPPRLVIFDATDKYNTDASLAIMRFVATHYDPVATLAALEVYRSRASRRRHR